MVVGPSDPVVKLLHALYDDVAAVALVVAYFTRAQYFVYVSSGGTATVS
jgi:hypothetical protein